MKTVAETLGVSRSNLHDRLNGSAKILKMSEEIKKQTIRKRRLQHQAAAA